MKRSVHAVLDDKAYSSHTLYNELKAKGIKGVIPQKSNEKRASDGPLRDIAGLYLCQCLLPPGLQFILYSAMHPASRIPDITGGRLPSRHETARTGRGWQTGFFPVLSFTGSRSLSCRVGSVSSLTASSSANVFWLAGAHFCARSATAVPASGGLPARECAVPVSAFLPAWLALMCSYSHV